MRIAVVQFPGSNCDWDIYHALKECLSVEPLILWHKCTELGGAEAVVLPGGFSFGDYLRCGALARFSPIMAAVRRFADAGRPVLGICNGFQVLCEAGLLPGALIRNQSLRFCCQMCDLAVEDAAGGFNRQTLGQRLRLPIAHGEGKYRIDRLGLAKLEAQGQILFRYTDKSGNPNGSLNGIAGICNRKGNVSGMMPHPERAVHTFHPSQDGIHVLRAWINSKL